MDRKIRVFVFCYILFSMFTTNVYADQTVNQELNWIWPADGVISDTFGTRGGKHLGVDVAGETGTPIFSVAEGVVSKSYYSDSYGNVVFITHKEGYETVYAHMEKRLVNEGEKVSQGKVIGMIGSTGHSSGPHLHFEVHKEQWTVSKENALDPFFIFGRGDIGQTVFALEKTIEPANEVMKPTKMR